MRIAIVKLSALGDIIHTMVVLQFIKKRYPDALIDWVVEARFSGLLLNNPDIHQIHTVNLKQAKAKKSLILAFREFKKVRRFGAYDLVIDAQGLMKSAIVARLMHGKQTWGFDKHSIRESFAAHFYTHAVNIAYDKNIIDRNIALIAALNIQMNQQVILNKQPFLVSFGNSEAQLIVLVLGASFPAKQYPIGQFAQVARALDEKCVAIWGNESERQLANALKKQAPNIEIAPKLNLDGLISVIKGAKLVIGGDTGPTHMAWALNVPSITLFGATPGYRNAYQTQINKILESDSKIDVYKINRSDDSIKNIPVKMIIKVAKELLLIAGLNPK